MEFELPWTVISTKPPIPLTVDSRGRFSRAVRPRTGIDDTPTPAD
jgi:hypothetical protein